MPMTPAANAPNRAVRKIRLKAILFLILALVAGGSAVLLVRNYLKQRGKAADGAVSTTPIVIASMDIAIATSLTKEHVTVTRWPTKHAPQGSFAATTTVIGRTVQQALLKGEPILASRLADEKAGRGMTALLAKGTRAMAVKVDQVVGVAGFVHPGDYVDVITTMALDEETKKELESEATKISKIILQNIKVLAVGEQITSQGTKPVKVSVVTLEVTSGQSERLALASRHGEIQLTMRSRVDQQTIPTAGITPLALLAPDEGYEPDEKDKGKDKGRDKAGLTEAQRSTLAWMKARERRQRGARRRVSRRQKEPKPAEPAAPVVEVLRGTKIEERKLKPTADTK
jgi:pilus assembly protein CpaB